MLTFNVFDATSDDNVRVRRGQNLDYWDGELG
jgi:hypothetical protein